MTGAGDSSSRVPANPQYRHEWMLGLGVVVGLAISCPTFLIEEFWHGKPLIDQGGIWWVLPAAIMALGFLLGGAIVGRHCRRAQSALWQGMLISAVTVWLIFIADLIRRHVLTQIVTHAVLKLWLVSALGAVVVGGVGGLLGYWLRAPARRTPM
jgi:hypothetical protein